MIFLSHKAAVNPPSAAKNPESNGAAAIPNIPVPIIAAPLPKISALVKDFHLRSKTSESDCAPKDSAA